MGVQLVEHLVERVFLEPIEVGVENVGERRAPDPIGHRVLRGGCDQSIERHHAGEPAHRGGQLAILQNTVEFEPPPELVADMDGAAFTMPLGGDARRVDFDQSGAALSRRR